MERHRYVTATVEAFAARATDGGRRSGGTDAGEVNSTPELAVQPGKERVSRRGMIPGG